MAKSHLIFSDFQETFHSTNVFFTPLIFLFFGCMGVRLLCARLIDRSFFAVNSVFGSFISKPVRQRQQVHWLFSVHYNFIHFFVVF